MKPQLVSFHKELVAGRTEIVESDDRAVFREHGMDGWILNYTVDGRGRINRGERRFTAEPGHLLLFKPGVAHDYHSDPLTKRWTHLWVYFFPRASWFEWLAWPEASPGILRLDLARSEQRARIVALFQEVERLSHAPLKRRVALAMSALEQLLLWCDAANPDSAQASMDPRIQRALDHLCANLEQPMRLDALARVCDMSPSRLSHLFRAQVGMTPMGYLEQQRVSQARELLLMTGRPIAEVSAAVGFQNPIWFTRVFRRHAGDTPRGYRKRGGAAPR